MTGEKGEVLFNNARIKLLIIATIYNTYNYILTTGNNYKNLHIIIFFFSCVSELVRDPKERR